jgi:hypothetical protein
VSQAAQSVGLPADRAELLAELLTTNDLWGIFSHSTTQIATYARLMRDGVFRLIICVCQLYPLPALQDAFDHYIMLGKTIKLQAESRRSY